MFESTEMWTTVGLILGGVLIATTTYFRTNGHGRDDPQQASMQDAMSLSITQMLDLMKEREKRDKRLP